jgi:hypothetical protein
VSCHAANVVFSKAGSGYMQDTGGVVRVLSSAVWRMWLCNPEKRFFAQQALTMLIFNVGYALFVL